MEVSIPASLPTFLERVLTRAVANPSSETIRPLYSILSGVGCAELLAVSQPLVARLQEQLKQLLCCSLDFDGHHIEIFCLAIYAKMASTETLILSSRKESSSLSNSDTSERCPEARFETARKYFGSQKASKTMDITVAKTRKALSQSRSQSCGATLDMTIELLYLCSEIVRSVSDIEKLNWMTNRRGMSKASLDGILRAELNPCVRTAVRSWGCGLPTVELILYQAAEFAIALYGQSRVPSELHGVIKQLFQVPPQMFASPDLIAAYVVSKVPLMPLCDC